jgi:virginiamycin A acetyltransferase
MSKNARYANHAVGEWTYGSPTILSWDDTTNFTIGKFCSIADEVTILLGGEHRTDWVTTFPFPIFFDEAKDFIGHPISKGDVIIGHDVWLGRGALIRSGVHIGNGAVVGAGSVVTKNVEPYSIVAGNPARHIRYRFSEETILALESISWWNLPVSEIKAALPLLLSDNVEAFTNKFLHKVS